GVLRALGATRFQVLRSVLAEAALMGLIGTLIGLAVGVPIEWYILQVILFEEAGFRFAVSVPWTEAAVIGVLAMVVATIAGLIPRLPHLRLRVPEATAYEYLSTPPWELVPPGLPRRLASDSIVDCACPASPLAIANEWARFPPLEEHRRAAPHHLCTR